MVNHKTIFSSKHHTATLQAKKFGYNFSKSLVVGILVAGLLGVSAFQAFAGNNGQKGGQKHTIKQIKKTTVKAKAGNKNHYGNSNSHASVDNSIRINTGGNNGGGGSAPSIHRNKGGKKNGNNNKDKKVVRKKVVRTVDNSYIDNSYVDNSYKEVDVSVKQVHECGDCYNNSVEYVYKKPVKSYPTYHKNYDYDHKNYDHDYEKDKKDYSHRGGKSTTTNTFVENNNNNDNYNDNSQYMEISFPHYYD